MSHVIINDNVRGFDSDNLHAPAIIERQARVARKKITLPASQSSRPAHQLTTNGFAEQQC